MDVVRITQALRQQQNSGRLASTTRGGSATLSSSSETLHINTATPTHASSMDSSNGDMQTPTSPGGLISPSSSLFSSLTNLLPGSVGAAAAAATVAAGSSNMGEFESLLLRSMPMFGNLVSRD
ncbi:hypothetical protein FBU30_005572 [Linnemannia zychae]|nr:hypothetical protein FBU30_005572 [Linnemannia zychae]